MPPPKRYFDSTAKEQSGDANISSTSASTAAASTTPKKERRASHAVRGQQTTLFVSSLPFTATSTDLITLFSDIGPLRRAFVVKDKESGKSKGVGYVSFAIREDAERALAELQGRSVDGGKRKMRIEWATGRPGVDVLEEETAAPSAVARDAEPSNVARQARPHQPSSSAGAERDAQAVRTIVMTGLADCKPAADSKSIYKRARKIGDVDNVIYPAQASVVASQVSDDVAQIIYRTPNHAMTAVTKLHAHTFKGAQISVVLKKRADGAAKLEAHMRPETKAKREALQQKVDKEQESVRASAATAAAAAKHDLKPDVNRGSRLIIRNLPFDVTDRDLRAIFLPYGPIYSIDVPQKVTSAMPAPKTDAEVDADAAADGGDDNAEDAKEANFANEAAVAQQPERAAKKTIAQGRGFAFVWHVSRSDAAKAIAGINGTTIAHGAAEKVQLKAAKGKAGRDAAKLALEEVSKTAQAARNVAVDWALSKKDWELKKDESEAEETDVEGSAANDSDDDDGDDDDDDDDEDDSDDESTSDLDPMEVDENSTSNDAEDEDEKPALPQPEDGTTLFIRNLPYQATEEELRALFRSFGPLRYAKVTMDKATKRPKGTAFICFWQKESADAAMQQAHLVESETGGSSALASTGTTGVAGKKKNPFTASSILTADPSAPLTASLSLHGRVLSVVPALDRSQADQLANVAQSAREKKDKRNTFLMREGVPMPNSVLAERLPEVEIERRLTAFQMRKTQLTKNPSLFISKTRLSIRQLPLFVTDKVLKRLAEFAVVEFDKQVKNGERESLTADELHESRRLAEEILANRMRKTASDATNAKGEDATEVSKKQMLKTKRNEALQRRLLTGKGGFVVVQSKIIRAKDRLDATTGLGRSHGYGFLEVATFADALKIVRFANANKAVRKLMLSWYAEELGQMAAKLRNKSEAAAAEGEAPPKDKKVEEEKTARLRRIERKKTQLEAGDIDPEEEGTRGGLLVVEFSVENVVTVKRRSERLRGSQAGGVKDRRPTAAKGRDGASTGQSSHSSSTLGKRDRGSSSGGRRGDDGSVEGAPSKRPRRPETWNQKTSKGGPRLDSQKSAFKSSKGGTESTTPKPIKQGAAVGSIIGRKRKMRQGK